MKIDRTKENRIADLALLFVMLAVFLFGVAAGKFL